MGYRDHAEFAWDPGADRPAARAAVEVRLADGTVRQETLGDDGRLRLDDVPPGPVEAVFGHDPRVWTPFVAPAAHEPSRPEDAMAVEVEPVGPILLASATLDRTLIAEAVGPDPEDGFVEWLWGMIKGDFDPDPEPSQIVATMGLGFVPVLGQLADLRDVIANVYLLSTNEGWKDTWRWIGLVVTLVAFVPGVGDVLKGCFRFAVRGLRGTMSRAATELAQAFATLGLGSPQKWLDEVDFGAVSSTVRGGLQDALRATTDAFQATQAKLLRSAEGADGARVWVRNAFGLSPGEPSRLTRNIAGTARALGDVVADLRRVEAEALQRLDDILDEMAEIVRRLVGGAEPRWAAAGIDGRSISGIELRPTRPLLTQMDEATGLDDVLGRRPGGRASPDAPDYRGRLRGEDVDLAGVPTRRVSYTVRDRDELARLRREFGSRDKKAFIDALLDDPEKVRQLRAAGLTDADIARMRTGRNPVGWQVHHKLPLDDGGTNDFSNLLLIKNEPYHKVLTNAQRELTRGLGVGQTRVVDFPTPPGFVYPPGP